MNFNIFKRRNLTSVFVLTLVFASLAIALPTFAESNPVYSVVKAVFSMEAKSEKIDANKIKTDSGKEFQPLLSAAQDCPVPENFDRADGTNIGANRTETVPDFSISGNRVVGSQPRMSATKPVRTFRQPAPGFNMTRVPARNGTETAPGV